MKQPLVDQYFCLSALFALKWLYWDRRKKLPDNSLLEYWLDDCNYDDYKNIWTQTNSQYHRYADNYCYVIINTVGKIESR